MSALPVLRTAGRREVRISRKLPKRRVLGVDFAMSGRKLSSDFQDCQDTTHGVPQLQTAVGRYRAVGAAFMRVAREELGAYIPHYTRKEVVQ